MCVLKLSAWSWVSSCAIQVWYTREESKMMERARAAIASVAAVRDGAWLQVQPQGQADSSPETL